MIWICLGTYRSFQVGLLSISTLDPPPQHVDICIVDIRLALFISEFHHHHQEHLLWFDSPEFYFWIPVQRVCPSLLGAAHIRSRGQLF